MTDDTRRFCAFPDRFSARFERDYEASPERLWRALVDEASEWFAVRPVHIEPHLGALGVFGLPDAPIWQARIIEFEPHRVLAFDHPAQFAEGGALSYILEPVHDGCRLAMTQRFYPGAVLSPNGSPGGDVPVHDAPFRPGFLAGFHLMFESLRYHLAGEPNPATDQSWLDLLPIYRAHIVDRLTTDS